jgi:uncharacterized Zn finger protein
VKQAIRDQCRLETGDINSLATSLRREIRLKTSEIASWQPWATHGHLPDYSQIQRKLENLLAAGHANLVIEIGEELWEQGNEQLEQSDDEGQTARSLADCMACVVAALQDSSLTIPEQILWWIDHTLVDDFGILDNLSDIQTNSIYLNEHWHEVSLVLEHRLATMDSPDTGDQHERSERKKLVDYLIAAYARCGDESKIVSLLEKEASRCLCYEKLVQVLMNAGNFENARKWCIEGYHQTINTLPGIAKGLQNLLREIANIEGRNDLVAAYRVHEYIERPSMERYKELQHATQDIQVWPIVRQRVLRYLESGKMHWLQDQENDVWPLPPIEIEMAVSQKSSPPAGLSHFTKREELVRIALFEERYDDAVEMYDNLAEQTTWGIYNSSFDQEVAKTVSTSHPDLSLSIWRNIVDRLIRQVNNSGYAQAATYLHMMHQVYKDTGRLAEWEALLRQIRLEHKLKRNLMAVLRELEEQISSDTSRPL